MAKGGKSRKRDNNKNPNKKTNHNYPYAAGDDDMMDDEIDAFHKQRDVVPLDVNEDIWESDEDNEHPVFDFEDAKDEDEDEDEDEDDDEDMEDDTELTGLAAKIARQQKYLRAKIGGVEDDMHNDAEDEEEKRAVWGRRKNIYYSADNVDYELQSSDEELPAEEEAEVLRLQKEKAKSLSMEDFGLEDVIQDETDREPTLEEILVKGKSESKVSADQKAQIDTDTVYEEVEKDLNALSRDEQMDVVYSSAPELVGLLSELNDALEQLENKVNPLLSKVRERREDRVKGGMHYMEVKQLLLMAYCQAITFYLLLKSEGQSVRDHPVIARLVEIKNLLEKMKQLDENLPYELEEILNTKDETEKEVKEVKLVKENDLLLSNSVTKGHRHSLASAEAQEEAVPHEASELVKVDFLKDNKNRGGKHKRQNDEVGIQSMEMLKVRAALEEKLKQKGIFSSIAPKHDKAQKHLQPVNGQLESFDDFDDDAIDVDGGIRGTSNGHSSLLRLSKLSQIATSKLNKPKFVSGDDDLPKRDDIGERRRKHELRVLAGAGIKSSDDFEDEPGFDLGDDDNVDDMEEDVGNEESEDEFYKQVKEQRDAKLAAKAEIYSRNLAVPLASIPETVVDGKRHISYQMEKNRGLTRARKKLTKNPRKKYKLQHQKAVKRRQGQVREIKKPSGPYGGEASGINAGISRSIRLK